MILARDLIELFPEHRVPSIRQLLSLFSRIQANASIRVAFWIFGEVLTTLLLYIFKLHNIFPLFSISLSSIFIYLFLLISSFFHLLLLFIKYTTEIEEIEEAFQVIFDEIGPLPFDEDANLEVSPHSCHAFFFFIPLSCET